MREERWKQENKEFIDPPAKALNVNEMPDYSNEATRHTENHLGPYKYNNADDPKDMALLKRGP